MANRGGGGGGGVGKVGEEAGEAQVNCSQGTEVNHEKLLWPYINPIFEIKQSAK